jgi:phosphoesterase RecJ-like protein
MLLDWSPFADLVGKHRSFCLTTHIRPDGDGLGSMLALAEAIQSLGKQTVMFIGSMFPPRYRFRDPGERIRRFESPPSSAPDVVIVLDTGTWNQLGDTGPYIRSLNVPKCVIDHHLTQDDLSARRFVDATAEATGRLAFEAIQALGVPLSSSAASHLFVALAMDTGWFRHANTTAKTFTLASELVAAGAQPEKLYQQLYEENSLARSRLTGLVLQRLQLAAGGRIAHTELHLADYAATGAAPQDTEDLVNHTRGITGVDVGLFLMEQPRGGVKVSFRSRNVDVAKVAEQFGGGGHRLASGATIDAAIDTVRGQVLEAVTRALDDCVSH